MFFDPEALLGGDAKLEAVIRQGFVRKVYGIVCAQLILTSLVATMMTFRETWRIWALTSPLLSMFSGLGLILIVGLSCVPSLRYRHPLNLVLLGILTFCIATSVGQACAIVAATQNSAIVLEALLATVMGTVGLVFFAFQTKYDLTPLNGILTIGLFSLLGASMLLALFPAALSFIDFGMSFLSSLIFSGYIMVDTQMISRGGYDNDDYISAALNVYLDIVNLFMAILRLLSKSQSQKDEDEN